MGIKQRIQQAAKFTRSEVAKNCPYLEIIPHWLNNHSFVYTDNSDQKPLWVDCQTGEQKPYNKKLPEAVIPKYTETISADGKWRVFVADYNLYLEDLHHHQIKQLTDDGAEDQAYAAIPGTCRMPLQIESGDVPWPMPGIFSPDGRWFLTHQLDEKGVKYCHIIDNQTDENRPKHYQYHHPYAGDKIVPYQKLVLVDLKTQTVKFLNCDKLYIEFFTVFGLKNWINWSENSNKIYYLRLTRGYKKLSLCEYDLIGDKERIVLTECAEKYIEVNAIFFWDSNVHVLENSREFIWWSERDNYGHLYLYDLDTGQLKQQITQGEWVVLDIYHIDQKSRKIWFTASGKEAGDPYYRYLYQVNFDGSGLVCLTPKIAEHFIQFSPDGQFFIDTCSTLRTAPEHVLCRQSGEVITLLASADISYLEKLNWVAPERFSIKALDNKTTLYGEIFKPTDFDENKKYPVIDHVYPGPQNTHVPKALCSNGNRLAYRWPGPWAMQALAEMGFIVITVDAPGSSQRSREFREASYGKMHRVPGAEHQAILEKLAKVYDYIDLSRVGITGHSAGGYATARALLTQGGFYKAGVAGSGVHDLHNFMAYWSEKYQGMLNTGNYKGSYNAALAENLERPLLLIHGEKDDNVHVHHSLGLYQALLKAGKSDLVDLVLLPCYHECDEHSVYLKKLWQFFAEYL